MIVCTPFIDIARNVTYRLIYNEARVQDVEPGVLVTS